MSGITDSKSSIKKILNLVEDINNLSTESVPKLSEQQNNILQALEAFEQEKNDKNATIASNKETINSLKEQISKDERTITNLNEEKEELTIKKKEYMEKIESVQKEIQELQTEIANKKEEFESRKQRLNDLEETITELKIEKDKFEDRIQKLEKDLEKKYQDKKNYVENYDNRVKAMKILIRNDYIKSEQVKLIKALQPGTTLELNHILMAIDLNEEKAREILRKMEQQNGPIEFDEQAGTVTLKEEVDF